ncbi:MAG: hypothetical protein ACREQ5_00210 [Candidatus Dormibacteria bacterium]
MFGRTGSKPSTAGYVYRCVVVVCVMLVGLCVLAVVVGPSPVGPVGAVAGCWWEPNTSQPGGWEPMGGSLSGAPVGSVIRPC